MTFISLLQIKWYFKHFSQNQKEKSLFFKVPKNLRKRQISGHNEYSNARKITYNLWYFLIGISVPDKRNEMKMYNFFHQYYHPNTYCSMHISLKL